MNNSCNYCGEKITDFNRHSDSYKLCDKCYRLISAESKSFDNIVSEISQKESLNQHDIDILNDVLNKTEHLDINDLEITDEINGILRGYGKAEYSRQLDKLKDKPVIWHKNILNLDSIRTKFNLSACEEIDNLFRNFGISEIGRRLEKLKDKPVIDNDDISNLNSIRKQFNLSACEEIDSLFRNFGITKYVNKLMDLENKSTIEENDFEFLDNIRKLFKLSQTEINQYQRKYLVIYKKYSINLFKEKIKHYNINSKIYLTKSDWEEISKLIDKYNIIKTDIKIHFPRLHHLLISSRIQEEAIIPRYLEEFVGQEKIIKELKIQLDISNKKKTSIGSILFYGELGQGKRTLAKALLNNLNSNIIELSPSKLINKGDLVCQVYNVNDNDYLFIKNIDKIKKPILQKLLDIKQKYKHDLVPTAQFGLIGSINHSGLPNGEIWKIFDHRFYFEPYSIDDIFHVLNNYRINKTISKHIAQHSNGNIGKAIKILKGADNRRIASNQHELTIEHCNEELKNQGIDLEKIRTIDVKSKGTNLQLHEVLQKAYNLAPIEFEALCKKCFEGMNYKVDTTATTGDGGIDLLLKKGNMIEIAQCKRFKGNISVKIVREFYGVIIDKQVRKGYIITTGKFTMPARVFAEDKGIHLIDGTELAEWIIELEKKTETIKG